MITIIGGPYGSKNTQEVKDQRAKIIATACQKIMADTKGIVALSPLLYGLSLIEKSGSNISDDWEFWRDFCLALVKTGDTFLVLNVESWDNSPGLLAEIEYAKKCEIPVYLVDAVTLEHIKVL